MTAPTDPQPNDVHLILRPAPSWSGDPMVRLRRFLKSMLRSFGWRCISISGLPPETPEIATPDVAQELP